MQQVTQQLKTGITQILEVPVPQVAAGELLVRNHYSLISAGTEGSTVKAARKGLIGKAKERPQQVKQVIDALQSQGPVQTYRTVMKKLEAYSPLGYSCAGEVIEVGAGVSGYRVGDRVACAGTTASHAEIVSVSAALCVKLTAEADLSRAAYNTLGAIALQGVRQADLRLGESCAVIGLGLLGQLTCLLLRAGGVKAFGIDVSQDAVNIAAAHASDGAWLRNTPGLSELILQQTAGLGVDAVIITAATGSTDPINFAGEICRKRGCVVVVGAVPTGFDREPNWYRKELELRMSCSYGPGRYDPQYEQKGHDYPAAYVRWTEQRNMQSFQEMLESQRIDVDFLTTHRFSLTEAADAYDLILKRSEPFLGILIEYDTTSPIDRSPIPNTALMATGELGVSFIGAGSYAQSYLLPCLPDKQGIERRSVLTRSGTTSKRVADKFSFAQSVSCEEDIFDDARSNVVFIATRHDSHGRFVCRSLETSKHVFVEKPLCLSGNELDEIFRTLAKQDGDNRSQLVVGYNRRFSQYALRLKSFFSIGPKAITYRVNAGSIPADSWIQDRDVGGGRIIGEACHFVDFIAWLCDADPVSVFARAIADPNSHDDTTSMTFEMSDGSIGTVHYFANGAAGLAKERVEVHQAGISGVLSDFKEVTLYGEGKPSRHGGRSQDKGQAAMLSAFFERIQDGGDPLIPLSQLYSVTDACIAVRESLNRNQPVAVRRVDQIEMED